MAPVRIGWRGNVCHPIFLHVVHSSKGAPRTKNAPTTGAKVPLMASTCLAARLTSISHVRIAKEQKAASRIHQNNSSRAARHQDSGFKSKVYDVSQLLRCSSQDFLLAHVFPDGAFRPPAGPRNELTSIFRPRSSSSRLTGVLGKSLSLAASCSSGLVHQHGRVLLAAPLTRTATRCHRSRLQRAAGYTLLPSGASGHVHVLLFGDAHLAFFLAFHEGVTRNPDCLATLVHVAPRSVGVRGIAIPACPRCFVTTQVLGTLNGELVI